MKGRTLKNFNEEVQLVRRRISFGEPLILKIRDGKKTETRRLKENAADLHDHFYIATKRYMKKEESPAICQVTGFDEEPIGKVMSQATAEAEGFDSPQEFMHYFSSLYKGQTFHMGTIIYVIKFKLILNNPDWSPSK